VTARVVVVVPVLRRPQNAGPLAESLAAATPEGAYRLLFVGSPGDVAEHEACRATGADLLVIDRPPIGGDWARKINFAYQTTDEPALFLGADDLRFHPGWLEAVERRVADGAHVVGTNDLGNARVMAGDHATHMLVTRSYVDEHGTVDERGKVLHEGYPHEWVDDEAVATAKMRGVWAHATDSHVEHLHPNWGKAPMDSLYAAQRLRMMQGRLHFERRRHLWEQVTCST